MVRTRAAQWSLAVFLWVLVGGLCFEQAFAAPTFTPCHWRGNLWSHSVIAFCYCGSTIGSVEFTNEIDGDDCYCLFEIEQNSTISCGNPRYYLNGTGYPLPAYHYALGEQACDTEFSYSVVWSETCASATITNHCLDGCP